MLFLKAEAKRPLKKAETIQALRCCWKCKGRRCKCLLVAVGFSGNLPDRNGPDPSVCHRAIHYAEQVAGLRLHKEFISRLEKAPSNIYENGASSYKDHVIPARVDLVRAGMHYAASSLFGDYPEHLEFFNYIADSEKFKIYKAGIQKLAVGRTMLKSKVSFSEKHFSFAVLYLGQLNIIGYISPDMSPEAFEEMRLKLKESFNQPDLGEVIVNMQSYFATERFTIWHLFRDEKRRILKMISDENLQQAENAYRDIYNDNYLLMAGVAKSRLPVPNTYQSAVKHVIKSDLDRFFQNGVFKVSELERLASEIKKWEITLAPKPSFRLAASERIFKAICQLDPAVSQNGELGNLRRILDILEELNVDLDIWKSQNVYFSRLRDWRDGKWTIEDKEWEEDFLRLGELLAVRTD